ncbi:stage II sporulation protein M [Mucilaginibacter gynuensis]|uniref:Stage II sporulation protein M n=1 Tax=Mucilaginibacter gynuensis TaxID=1302236 RepID=A0ABP8GWE2_9SPHI
MREALFIKQNSARWRAYEADKSRLDPDQLAESFISITDDLAYAKTFYPRSNTTKYLNGLASGFHQSIYRNKKEKSNRFILFWRYELPLIFFKHRRLLLYSFAFFLVSTLMGVLSAKYDGHFVNLILGDGYVNMTNDNIAKGDPFGVYKKMGEFEMFLMIGLNNIWVELKLVVSGIFLSVGSLYMLVYNGIMLGSFQYYFFSKGLGLQSVLVIWIHGTLEISTIIISGAAGLILGNSLLFPKTYSRLVSLKAGGKDAIKIALGILPIIVTAAFFEGYVTRHTEMPIWLSVTILVLSFIFILWYVVIYPAVLNKQFTQATPYIDDTEV